MSFPVVALGDVAEFIRGVTYKPSDLMDNFSEGAIVCMRTANVQKVLDESDLLSIPRGHVKSEEKILREGDLLVSTANSWNLVGKCCWVPALSYAATVGGFIAALRGDKSKVDLRYLYHWFNSPDTQVDARNCGRQTTNISNMDIARCLALTIPLPPIPEQRRIAAVLDKADALRAKRREAIAKLNQLLQATFFTMFEDNSNWPETAIGDICLVKGGKRLPKGEAYSDAATPFRYIRVSDIESGRIHEQKLKYLKPETQQQIKRYTVSAGDVVITIAGSIGLVAPVGSTLEGANLTENAAKLVSRVSMAYEPEYLAFALSTPEAQKQIKSHTGQVTIGKLALFRIEKVTIALPPLHLQKKFVQVKGVIEGQLSKLTSSATQLDLLFASLQQRAFEGRSEHV